MEAKKSSLILSNLTHKLLGAKWNYRLRYFHQRGHLPSLKNPKDLSEILISQMFTQSVCVSYAPYVDKLAVRDYIQWRGMDNILLKHYGVWSKPEDVEFDKLPDKFVMFPFNTTPVAKGNSLSISQKAEAGYSFSI